MRSVRAALAKVIHLRRSAQRRGRRAVISLHLLNLLRVSHTGGFSSCDAWMRLIDEAFDGNSCFRLAACVLQTAASVFLIIRCATGVVRAWIQRCIELDGECVCLVDRLLNADERRRRDQL